MRMDLGKNDLTAEQQRSMDRAIGKLAVGLLEVPTGNIATVVFTAQELNGLAFAAMRRAAHERNVGFTSAKPIIVNIPRESNTLEIRAEDFTATNVTLPFGNGDIRWPSQHIDALSVTVKNSETSRRGQVFTEEQRRLAMRLELERVKVIISRRFSPLNAMNVIAEREIRYQLGDLNEQLVQVIATDLGRVGLRFTEFGFEIKDGQVIVHLQKP